MAKILYMYKISAHIFSETFLMYIYKEGFETSLIYIYIYI